MRANEGFREYRAIASVLRRGSPRSSTQRALGVLAALLALAGSASGCSARPQAPETLGGAEQDLDAPIPLDAQVRSGRLPNGLAYYILPHTTPKKRAQLWLAVNAGSALEDEDQRGLAHFVEHMGFNGTRRFPKHALIDVLERTGVQFGPDLNASTTLEATTYMLQIPTDEPGLVDTGLAILRDWAGDIAFGPAEVEAERGVVLEEWRRGRGAEARLRDKALPVLFHASPLAERLPIGRPEIIRSAPAEALVRYYRDWYRPERMAVIAVGDVNVPEIEARIAAEFSSLRAAAPPRPYSDEVLPAHAETLVSVETDPEASTTSVSLYTKLPARSYRSLRDYRRALAEALVHQMLNARLDERRREPDAVILSASSWTGRLIRSADTWVRRAVVPPDGVEAGLATLLAEGMRVERHGFTPGELERAKRDLLRRYELAASRRDRRDSQGLAWGLARHFYEQRFLAGSAADLALATQLLPTIGLPTLEEQVRAFAQGSRVIVVQGPAEMKAPSRQSLLAVLSRSAEQPLEPYRDRVASELAVELPPRGAVIRAQHIDEIGVTEWRLANGARVVLKPTDFDRDEVRMLAFSPGGHSLADDAGFDSALFSDLIVEESGTGALDPVALRRALTGTALSLRVHIGELKKTISGTSTARDLETLLRLAHLAFTAPRRDEAAFRTWRTRQIEAIRNRRASPERVFFDEMDQILTQGHPRRQPLTAERLQGIDLDRALAFYRDRFADAGDFVFVFVGNLDPAELQPLVERYLGSLPASGRAERWRDIGMQLPAHAQTRVVTQGEEQKSRVMLAFRSPHPWSKEAASEVRALVEALRLRLREVLREDLGGVYGVSVDGALRRRPLGSLSLTIGFGCAPENVDALQEAVRREIRELQAHGLDATHVAKLRSARTRAHELDLERNGFWLRELARAWRYGDDPREIIDVAPALAPLTSERTQSAARTYLDLERTVVGVLLPSPATPPVDVGTVRPLAR